MSQTDQLDAAEQITCPHLLIEAEEGAKFDPEVFQQILQVMLFQVRFPNPLYSAGESDLGFPTSKLCFLSRTSCSVLWSKTPILCDVKPNTYHLLSGARVYVSETSNWLLKLTKRQRGIKITVLCPAP